MLINESRSILTTTLLIVFELTSNYQVALGAGISVCFANLISSKIYGHSAFDQILLNRNIDLKLGRDNLHLKSILVNLASRILKKKVALLFSDLSLTKTLTN